ncbi:MAG: CIA30 family protein [Gallionella sp.]
MKNLNTPPYLIDDRSCGSLDPINGTCWRVVTDKVMGGRSESSLTTAVVEGRHCLRMTGAVSLENNGGFVQASLDLCKYGLLDASAYSGIEIEIFGNGEMYNLHLRTDDTRIVWQSYRAYFQAIPAWQTIRFSFENFQGYRIDKPLDKSKLRRLGVVAIGRIMQADIHIAKVSLYS